eukprot:800667-Pelagomonas_calceolata.AAC.1
MCVYMHLYHSNHSWKDDAQCNHIPLLNSRILEGGNTETYSLTTPGAPPRLDKCTSNDTEVPRLDKCTSNDTEVPLREGLSNPLAHAALGSPLNQNARAAL